jgi:biotin synthase
MPGHRSLLLRTSWRAVLQDAKPQSIVRKYGTVAESPAITTPQSSVFEDALAASSPRTSWTKEEIKQIYDTPLMKLAFAAVSKSIAARF